MSKNLTMLCLCSENNPVCVCVCVCVNKVLLYSGCTALRIQVQQFCQPGQKVGIVHIQPNWLLWTSTNICNKFLPRGLLSICGSKSHPDLCFTGSLSLFSASFLSHTAYFRVGRLSASSGVVCRTVHRSERGPIICSQAAVGQLDEFTDMSEILVSQFRLLHSWSTATIWSISTSAFFFVCVCVCTKWQTERLTRNCTRKKNNKGVLQ